MKIIQIFTFFFIAVVVNGEKKSFKDHKLYKIVPESKSHVAILEKMKNTGVGDFWNEYFREFDDVRVVVSTEKQSMFLVQLKQAGLEPKIIIEDVQKAIDDQMKPANYKRSSSFLSYDWDQYHPLEDIEKWIDELVKEYPNIISAVTMDVKTVENREIRGIVINYNPEREKPKAMIEGTLHAREWISPATITWMVKEFLTSSDPDVRFMAENLEWHVFPVVNPDGYVYTFTQHRMWRKNRSQASFKSCATTGVHDDMSNGVDLNRNFDFFWMSVGASNEPCLNTYAGPSAASEPETRAITQYVLDLKEKGDIIYYLSFHSFTQLFILPYSHVEKYEDMPADNHYHLVEIANNSATRLAERYGTSYKVGIAADVLYPMSGSSFDWVKYYANASISYLIELRDMGEYGFLLPASQIIPNNEEVMDAMIEMDKTARRLGYYNGSSTFVFSISVLLAGLIYLNLLS